MKLKTLICASLITIVASLSPAQAQTFSVVHTFTSSGGDGAYPSAGLSLRGGVLYGTTKFGGRIGHEGTVYQITRVGSSWMTAPIFPFPDDGSFGANPQARVVFGTDGHLWGTTAAGGSSNEGVVFRLTPPLSICKTAACFWTPQLVHSFTGNPDGESPGFGNLVWDSTGNAYGTTPNGGLSDAGTVYGLQPSGNSWVESILYNFSGPDGAFPVAGVTLDGKGNIFGAASEGGLHGFGNIFKLTHTPDAGWKETVLYDFQNGSDGETPIGGLVLDNNGNLYGVAAFGGSGAGGTIFELSPFGDTWTFKVIYSVPAGPNCAGIYAPVTMDAGGNLYGTTYCDGQHGFGSVFKLANTQNGWVYTPLHQFTGNNDGAFPISTVAFDADGSLFGTTTSGGSTNFGVVWMIKP